MATAEFIVKSALEDIGADSIINPAGPELLSATFKTLVEMLNVWLTKVDLGDNFVFPTTIKSDMQNDSDTDSAMHLSLSILAAPKARKIPTRDQKMLATAAFNDLLVNHAARPEQPYPSTLNRGAGRRHFPHSRRYYREPQRKDTQTVKADPQ